jgi:hypothetical protein
MQHLQSQATEKMEILTEKMHKIGSMSQREAVAMKIITVVTLIYLPATFVSVSMKDFILGCALAESFEDHLQYGYRQIPRPR